jgi:hypothetical protein
MVTVVAALPVRYTLASIYCHFDCDLYFLFFTTNMSHQTCILVSRNQVSQVGDLPNVFLF